MITVYFKKSPTGNPFFLAYSQGEHGHVTEQMALELEKAGIIDPVSHTFEKSIPAGDFELTEELEPETPESEPDLSTEIGAKAVFGKDLDAMREYCDTNKIKYGKAAKRPEYFWKRIAKHNSK